MQWIRFRNRRGSLNTGFRTEIALAQLCALFANANSKNGGYRVHDFAPHLDEPVMSLEEAMKAWG